MTARAGQEPRHIALSGATGFLGSWLIRHCRERGIEVSPIVRSAGSFPNEILIGAEADLVAAVRARQPDAVLHIAAAGGVNSSVGEFAQIVQANITLGSLLMHAAAEADAHFLTTGSFSQRSCDANGRVSPSSFYAASKSALESIAEYFCGSLNLRATFLQLTDVYGPRDGRKRLLSLLADATLSGEPIGVTAGEQVVSFVHVDDVVDAIFHCIARDLGSGSPAFYGVNGPEIGTLRGAIEGIESELGIRIPAAWGERSYRENEVMVPSLLDLPPDWTPRVPIATGFQQLLTSADS